MAAYAMAHIRTIDLNEEVLTYIREIDATLEPYEGRFIVHGVEPEVREEPFPGALVAIEFPDIERARAWFDSDAYRRILPLRTEHIRHAVGDLPCMLSLADRRQTICTAWIGGAPSA